MPNTSTASNAYDPESSPVGTTGKPTSVPGPDEPNPSVRQRENATVKNPQHVGVAKDSAADRVANRAAHKAARDEQRHDKANDIFTH